MFNFHLQSSLLTHLTPHCLFHSLTRFHAATGQIPPVDIPTMSQQDTSLIKNHSIDTYAKRCRFDCRNQCLRHNNSLSVAQFHALHKKHSCATASITRCSCY